MGRPAKPWYWAARDGWYTEAGGKPKLLAKGQANKAEAERQFHRLMGADPAVLRADDVSLSVRAVCLLFLDHARDTLEEDTFAFYARHLKSFVASCGMVGSAALRPLHVSAWLSQYQWSDSNKRGAITSVKRAFRWAFREGHIPSDPLVNVDRPPMSRREKIPTGDQARAILDGIRDRQFRDLLTAMWETGCRPGEASRVEAKDADLEAGTWTVKNKTRRKTGRARTIYLNAAMVEMTRRLAHEHPKGPLFLNMRGNPWTRNAMTRRFEHIRDKHGLGREATAYAMRHLYITDALERGVPIATVAELVGHTSTTMIMTVYSKLSERTAHLREAAAKVRPDDQKP